MAERAYGVKRLSQNVSNWLPINNASHPKKANTLFVTNCIVFVSSRLRTNLLAASHLLIKDTAKYDAVTLILNDSLSYESDMTAIHYSNKGTK